MKFSSFTIALSLTVSVASGLSIKYPSNLASSYGDVMDFNAQLLGLSSSSSTSSSESTLSPLWLFSDSSHEILLMNDPVMGGVSSSTYTLVDGSVVSWVGTVENVPSLAAPGFCLFESAKKFDTFPDAKGATHLSLLVKSTTAEYQGFKVSFAANTLNPQFKSFKANWYIASDTPVDEATGYFKVSVPFSNFSNNWSSYTGDPIVKCEDDSSVCPSGKDLSAIQQFAVWAEGVAGPFQLDVLGVYAETVVVAPSFAVPTVESGDDCTSEYKVEGSTCGELCLSSTVAPFAEKFGGVTKGKCETLGYTVLDHTEEVDMGPFGKSSVSVYTKPQSLFASIF